MIQGVPTQAVGAGVAAENAGLRGITVNHFVPSKDRVDHVPPRAEPVGGTIVRPAQQAQWGGSFGHFSDPDGYVWKVG